MVLSKEELKKYIEENGEDAVFENLFRCAGSDEYYDREDDGEWIDDEWFSYEWLDANVSRCAYCDEYIINEDATTYVEGYGTIHDSCYYNGDFATCEGCGRVYETDVLDCDDYGDYYCENCYRPNGHDARVRCYHEHKGHFDFYKLQNEKNPYYIGFELEMEHKNNDTSNEEEALDILQRLNVVFEEDGSLDESGVEVISHPQSYNYIMKNKDKMKQAFEEVVKLGYISHNSSNCGLHFHFTRPKNDVYTIKRIWLILETFKNEIQQITRRNGDSHWCHWISDETSQKIRALDTNYINNKKDNGRYHALNNTNEKTIEFRIFKGTLNFETFMSDLQFLNNIYKLAKSKIDLCDITWDALTKGEYISKYIKEKGIKSNKIVKDYTLTLSNYENKIYLNFVKIKNIISKNIMQKFNNINKYDILDNYDGIVDISNDLQLLKSFENYAKQDDVFYYTNDAIYYANDLKQKMNSEEWQKIDNIIDKIRELKREVDGLCV